MYAIDKCESLVSGNRLILHGNPSAIAKDCSQHMEVVRRHFSQKALPVLYDSQGTLGGNFDVFAASVESTAWVLLWKTRSRPIGVRACPVAQFKFSVPHLIRVRGR